MNNKLTKSITENERYQYPRASGLPTVSLGPEALRASVPPLRVPQITAAGYLNKGKRKLAPAIPALAREWNHQDGSAPLASFGNESQNIESRR